MDANFIKKYEEIIQAQLKLSKSITESHEGLRTAVLLLAISVAGQKDINAKKLADDFSALVEMNCPENVPMPVLDVRAGLYQVAQSRA